MSDSTETVRKHVLASAIDLVVALCAGMLVFAVTGTVVTVLFVAVSGAPLPGTLLELEPIAAAFWAFELLVFTPFGWFSASAAITTAVLGWLARSGLVAYRSPGMLLAGISARPARGSAQ